jgi:hypothetical protein
VEREEMRETSCISAFLEIPRAMSWLAVRRLIQEQRVGTLPEFALVVKAKQVCFST